MSSATKKRVEEDDGQVKIQALFGLFFVITQFPSLITHHFKYYTRLAPSLNFHHSIFFTLFVGPIPVTHCRLLLFFFFFQYPNSPNLVKKKKDPEQTEPVKEEEEEEEERIEQPTQEKKGKKKSQKVVRSCGWVLFVGLLCVFDYNIAIEL